MARPAAKKRMFRFSENHNQIATTMISSNAFSRVSASSPIAAPNANNHLIADCCNQPQRQAHEEHVQHGFLQQAVEEDRRRPERQREAGGEADLPREQAL